MKLLNFRINSILLEVEGCTFDLHNCFRLAGYSYDSRNRIFELTFEGDFCPFGTDNPIQEPLKMIFRQVSFLHIKDTSIDETNICFGRMDVGRDREDIIYSIPEEFAEARPHHIVSSGGDNTFSEEPVAGFDWRNSAYIDFTWGVTILITAETAEVSFEQDKLAKGSIPC
ncbi:MAG TPA: hypothetical protein V6D06_19230 [Trichocoleus sp.]